MYRHNTNTFLRASLLLLLGATYVGADEAADEAAIQDPAAECTWKPYAPLADANATGLFPTVWTPLTAILPNDAAGQAKFASMKGNIPNIPPKGIFSPTIPVNPAPFDGVTYSDADPDCWWTKSQCVQPKLAGLPADIATVPEPRTLGYGFDDGPNCSHNAFYDYLTEQNQKATMFFVGSNVADWPLQARRAVVDGHEICVHTWSHGPMTTFSNEGAFAELWYTQQVIKAVTGYTPKCWRPPTGDVDDRIRYIATQLGMDTVLWKYDSFDWTTEVPEIVQANYDGLLGNLSAGAFDTIGAIILTHELNNFTMQMAVENYPKLAAAFDHIVPISVAQNRTQPYVESNFSMPSFADYIESHKSAAAVSSNSSSSAGGKSSGGGGSGSNSNIGGSDSSGESGAVNVQHSVSGVVLGAIVLLVAAFL
ncbi:carbohydrate esterase family 4 protein [Mycena crocata]|nr:carbohydrate esterase family 4 protein [Mycena crocata]